ncbi:lipopolysaccharide biosynthesis protein [Alteraurantiacibacter aquimixticola]|uniref:Lipopolysaccharide biosynthesis protein n=1 Tax=Alteraurantiacibacter aquimixticola TaxID=2489173 RepID=A0A4T3F0C0_9SPHN|nr:lipopolysaccharide biosynthesis protein [Alteraurantiacibacter aquimixticola]TIX50501.1 lipopolysaccharide biosynthesis protein [Alteraurantiacibacter aquimixticola]
MIRRALTNTGWLMGARGVNAVLSLVYLALATRALGLAGFGQFILCVTFAQALVGFTSFQTWQGIVRWGQTKEELPDATGFALALDGLTIIAGTVIAALILAFAGDWLPLPGELRLATFALTVISLLSIRSTPTGILRLHDRYARAATADSITSIVRVIGAVLVFAIAPSIIAFLAVWAAAEVATAALYWLFARQTQPLFLKHVSLTRIPAREDRAWSFVFGTAFSAMVVIASRQLLVLLVGALGGAALAGIYRVAMQIGEGLLKLAQALLKATYPELVRSPELAKQIAGRITRIALITGIGAVLLALVAGRWLIGVIAGEDFQPAYTPMILLSAAAAFELVGASLEALLVARGKAITNFLLRLVPTLVALAALGWLIAEHGAAGAGMAVLGASVVTVAGLYFANKRMDAKAD